MPFQAHGVPSLLWGGCVFRPQKTHSRYLSKHLRHHLRAYGVLAVDQCIQRRMVRVSFSPNQWGRVYDCVVGGLDNKRRHFTKYKGRVEKTPHPKQLSSLLRHLTSSLDEHREAAPTLQVVTVKIQLGYPVFSVHRHPFPTAYRRRCPPTLTFLPSTTLLHHPR